MIALLAQLGFTPYDVALLLLCPIGAMIGSYAQILMLTAGDFREFPANGKAKLVSPLMATFRVGWVAARIVLGAVVGLVLALYFVGALQQTAATFARVFGLSILLGYAAPRLWLTQERLVAERMLELVKAELNQAQVPPQSTAPRSP